MLEGAPAQVALGRGEEEAYSQAAWDCGVHLGGSLTPDDVVVLHDVW